MSNLIVAQTLDELSELAGLRVLQLGNDAITDRGQFVIALSGGSTPRKLHEFLSRPKLRSKLDWTKAVFLWGDERCVAPDHADSNFRMARQTLLEPLGIEEHQWHRMPADDPKLAEAASRYEAEIRNLLPGSLPRIDVVLLGMGDDGHTASLFPQTVALQNKTDMVVANEVPQLETWRMTMTYPLINAARNVLFLVQGANKAARLKEVLHGPADPTRLPSQAIEPTDGKLTWFLDSAAAADLPCV